MKLQKKIGIPWQLHHGSSLTTSECVGWLRFSTWDTVFIGPIHIPAGFFVPRQHWSRWVKHVILELCLASKEIGFAMPAWSQTSGLRKKSAAVALSRSTEASCHPQQFPLHAFVWFGFYVHQVQSHHRVALAIAKLCFGLAFRVFFGIIIGSLKCISVLLEAVTCIFYGEKIFCARQAPVFTEEGEKTPQD